MAQGRTGDANHKGAKARKEADGVGPQNQQDGAGERRHDEEFAQQ
jgi:hypothetical protein